MRRMFDFMCPQWHVTEHFIDIETKETECPVCKETAQRVVSAPNIKLEGITGDFPGAHDRWARIRAEKLKQERKQAS